MGTIVFSVIFAIIVLWIFLADRTPLVALESKMGRSVMALEEEALKRGNVGGREIGDMVRPKEPVTESRLAKMMVSLYPVRGWRRKIPPFRFGFVPIPGTPLGCCLDDGWPKRPLRRLVQEYVQATGREFAQVYGEIVEDRSSVLLVDPIAYEIGKWPAFLLVAVHEYAHFLRGTMRAIYRTDYSVKNFEEAIGEQFDFDDRVRGRRTYRRHGPLFDGWCWREGDADPPIAHDPLFFFILYFLERKAAEKGYFRMRAKPVLSVGSERAEEFD